MAKFRLIWSHWTRCTYWRLPHLHFSLTLSLELTSAGTGSHFLWLRLSFPGFRNALWQYPDDGSEWVSGAILFAACHSKCDEKEDLLFPALMFFYASNYYYHYLRCQLGRLFLLWVASLLPSLIWTLFVNLLKAVHWSSSVWISLSNNMHSDIRNNEFFSWFRTKLLLPL